MAYGVLMMDSTRHDVLAAADHFLYMSSCTWVLKVPLHCFEALLLMVRKRIQDLDQLTRLTSINSSIHYVYIFMLWIDPLIMDTYGSGRYFRTNC